jgi:hypothetical protein
MSPDGEDEGDMDDGEEGENMDEDEEQEPVNPTEDAKTPLASQPEPPIPASTTPAPSHTSDAIPSNAIEMVNAAPGHAEEGLGDLGTSGMEVHLPQEVNHGAAKLTQSTEVEEGETAGGKDEGLIMGELEPPDEAMAVDGQKAAGPPETES